MKSLLIASFSALVLAVSANFGTDKSEEQAAETAPAAVSAVNWLTFEEAVEKNKTAPRKIVVDIYTDWCGWCKRMDKTTFSQAQIASYLNENYYPVKFNAEQKEEILFNGKEYGFVSNGRRGYHELAAEITGGMLSYPTTVFLDEDMKVIQAIKGFKDADSFEQIATYFGGDYHKKTPWESYRKNYKPLRGE